MVERGAIRKGGARLVPLARSLSRLRASGTRPIKGPSGGAKKGVHGCALTDIDRLVARPSAHPAPAPRNVRLTAEDYLARALAARTSGARARAARAGLASRLLADRTTQALLLRQLSIAYFESRRFRKAYEVALQALELRVLVDVVHQDAARAA